MATDGWMDVVTDRKTEHLLQGFWSLYLNQWARSWHKVLLRGSKGYQYLVLDEYIVAVHSSQGQAAWFPWQRPSHEHGLHSCLARQRV